MLIEIRIENQTFRVNAESPLDISIPLDFYGEQPNAYGVEKAVSKPCEAGALVGDTRRGGSCNFEQITLIPHCNGTHTECVGHLTRERVSVRNCLTDAFALAALVSIEPEKAIETSESYAVSEESDELLTRRAIEQAWRNLEKNNPGFPVSELKSLIVRTLPNDGGKKARVYLNQIPPYFSTEAMNFIIEKGIRHLLVDTPSIDRIFDQGRLSNHRIFWQIEPGSFQLNEKSSIHHTVTELIYVADKIADGFYLLNLQIAPFAADAAPSRPVLFEIYA